MASLSVGNSPSARATRTCSRAGPGASPVRQLSHAAHDSRPSRPPAYLFSQRGVGYRMAKPADR